MFHFFKKKFKGFTIIEMLLSLGIITSIISMVGTNQSTFTATTKLNNVAENLAADIRLTQALGENADEGNFNGTFMVPYSEPPTYDTYPYVTKVSSAYVLYLELTPEEETHGSYVKYHDSRLLGDGDSYSWTDYTYTTQDFSDYTTNYTGFDTCPSVKGYQDCLEKVELPEGYRITEVCLLRSYGGTCGDTWTPHYTTKTAIYSYAPSNGVNMMADYFGWYTTMRRLGGIGVAITITGPDGRSKTVNVNTNGLVEVI